MAEMKGQAVATVIGDVVGSRRSPDRQGLHARLTTALATEAEGEGVMDPLAITVGDEFQGTFATLGAAIDAAWRVRLALLPEVDVRIGLGWGEVTALDESVQDGPGWWDAREAITWVAQEQSTSRTTHLRTAYRSRATGAPSPGAVNAALHCRDHLLGSLDDRSRRILGGLMADRTQAEIAHDEGISASAVSQRVRTGGIAVLRLAADELATVGATG